MNKTQLRKSLQPSKFTKEDFVKLLEIETDPIIIEIMEENLRLTPDHKFKTFSENISLSQKMRMENQK